ncbi:hybrid sensor histidine kinase/response regulator [Roseateles sp.]|uniref:ATP-binding response regulator n=1 Tax=Roseateles sp. TaxID=1971397 RepID=UPI0032642AF6
MRSEPRREAPSPLVLAYIHQRFEETFLGQSRRAQIGMLLGATLIAAIWFNRVEPNRPIAMLWEGIVLLVTSWRMRYTPRFVHAAPPGGSMRRIAALLAVNGVLMALPLCDFQQFNATDRAAVSIVLLTTATASTVTTSGYRSLFLAFAAPMLVPLAAAWMWVGARHADMGAWGLGALILVFLLFLISLGRQVNETFEASSRYRHGEQQLNEELTRALERADESNRAKTQFLAAASHDLRQPIHAMTVLVAVLMLRNVDSDSAETIKLLDSVNQTLSKQLDSLLDISKLDAGTVMPRLAPCRLDALLIAHGEAMHGVAAERGIELTLQCSERMTTLTDEALFARVLQNLTDNALKFTPAGGRVSLSLQHVGDDAVLAISDTGIGMAADEHAHVFREFYQVANVERDRTKGLGLGLGLSIVQRLCGLLGVPLSLASAPGAGTTVTLRLPLSTAEGRPAPVAGPVDLRDLSVLVIDDEAIIRNSMRALLGALGCRVQVAESGAQAADIVAAGGVDAILSDLRLRGGECGIEVLEQLRLIEPHAITAFITGDTAPERLSAAHATGVPVLIKPVGLPALLKVLRPKSD